MVYRDFDVKINGVLDDLSPCRNLRAVYKVLTASRQHYQLLTCIRSIQQQPRQTDEVK
jgi:hypothetical protein